MTTQNRSFTIDDMTRLLEEAAGVADGIDWTDATTLDKSFDDLGYDSLGLIEFAAKVRREYQITMSDDVVTDLNTPRSALDYVTRQIG